MLVICKVCTVYTLYSDTETELQRELKRYLGQLKNSTQTEIKNNMLNRTGVEIELTLELRTELQ